MLAVPGPLLRFHLSTPTLSSCVIAAAHVSCHCHLASAIRHSMAGQPGKATLHKD